MARREDRDLTLGVQVLGVEAGGVVERPMQQGYVGPAVVQQPCLLARPAQHDVHGDGAGLGGVGVEEFRRQFTGGARLRGQNHGGAAGRREGGPAGAPFGGLDGVQRRPRLPQQHRPCPVRATPRLPRFSRRVPRRRSSPPIARDSGRLGDPEPLRGPAEVQLLGDRDEVPQLTCLQPRQPNRDGQERYPGGIAVHPVGLGRPARRGRSIDVMSETNTMNHHKVALVTGANKGIGYEIAAGLGALGWSVGIGARNEERREAAVDKLRAAGADAFGVPLDVTDDASVTAAARLIEERAGRLDGLVNNAGITGGGPQEPTTVDVNRVWVAVETNVIGVIRVTNALLSLLRRPPSSRIVSPAASDPSRSRPRPAARRAPSPSPTLRRRRSSTPSPCSTPRNWPAPTS